MDSDNIKAFEELLADFKDMQGKVNFSYSPTRKKYSTSKFYPYCLKPKSYKKETDRFYDLILTNDFGKEKMPQQIFHACQGDLVNGFAIDPYGDVYKCLDGINTSRNKLGALDNKGNLKLDQKEFLKWCSWDVFEDQECRECKYLPLCMGGNCLLYNIEKREDEFLNGKTKACYYLTNRIDIGKRIKKFYFKHKDQK